MSLTPYIQTEYRENVKKFKYKGSDNSIFYRHFTSPLCDITCRYLPANLA